MLPTKLAKTGALCKVTYNVDLKSAVSMISFKHN